MNGDSMATSRFRDIESKRDIRLFGRRGIDVVDSCVGFKSLTSNLGLSWKKILARESIGVKGLIRIVLVGVQFFLI